MSKKRNQLDEYLLSIPGDELKPAEMPDSLKLSYESLHALALDMEDSHRRSDAMRLGSERAAGQTFTR